VHQDTYTPSLTTCTQAHSPNKKFNMNNQTPTDAKFLRGTKLEGQVEHPTTRNPYMGILPPLVLTIQDYFKHFQAPTSKHHKLPHSATDGFKYQPQLLTSEERSWLARSLVTSSVRLLWGNDLQVTQLPAFQSQIAYIKNEFERLRVHMGWGTMGTVYRTNHDTFMKAVANTCRMMIRWAQKELHLAAIVNFFNNFEGVDYTPNHHAPALEEFDRLCKAKKWSREMQSTSRLRLDKILSANKQLLHVGHGPAILDTDSKSKSLAEFFNRFKPQYPGFSYDPQAYPPAEFQRLLKVIGWQTKEYHSTIRRDFNALYGSIDCWTFYGRVRIPGVLPGGSVKSHERSLDKEGQEPVAAAAHQFDLSNPPLVKFFRRFERETSIMYHYGSKSPIEEFHSLSERISEALGFRAASDRWIATMPMNRLGPHYRFQFWRSEIYRVLQDQFYQAIEEQFDWFVDIQCSKKGIKQYEYLVLFFELSGSQTQIGGKQLDEAAAYNVRWV